MLIFAERFYNGLETDFNLSNELYKLSDNPYKTKNEPKKDPFNTSPGMY